jgi:hypothetical protein
MIFLFKLTSTEISWGIEMKTEEKQKTPLAFDQTP